MNLKGGYKIIDLSSISLVGSEGGDYTAITDKKILEQLLSLKDYLDDSKELKPIYLRAKTSGKETVMGSLAKKIGEDILYIDAKLISSSLSVKVVFERDAETEEISIDEAGYLYVSDADSVMADVAKAESGTIVDVLGLDSDGKIVKGAISGGTKLYMHTIKYALDGSGSVYYLYLITTDSSRYTLNSLYTLIKTQPYKILHCCNKPENAESQYTFIGFNASGTDEIYADRNTFRVLCTYPGGSINIIHYTQKSSLTIVDNNIVLTNTVNTASISNSNLTDENYTVTEL